MGWVFNERYFRRTDPDYWGGRRIPIFKDVTRLLRRFGVQSVLDVGAAYGHFPKWAMDQGFDASGCDISESAVEWGLENLDVPLRVGRIQELDFPADSFDCVVSLDTLYYVADPAGDLTAIRRLLKPGGCVILRLRSNRRLRPRAREAGKRTIGGQVVPAPHIWGFTPKTVDQMLTKCGFRTELLEPAAYSKTALGPVYRLGLAANRALARSPLSVPILTRSFNVVAVRAD
jgi:SAM-dependent methyltransferase